MSDEAEKPKSGGPMRAATLCLAVGIAVSIAACGGCFPVGGGNIANTAAGAQQLRVALLLLVTVIGAVLAYQLGVIADRLPKGEKKSASTKGSGGEMPPASDATSQTVE